MLCTKWPVILELRSSRLSRAQKILPSVARAWPITVYAPIPRQQYVVTAFLLRPTSIHHAPITLITTLASRLNCDHCVFTAISRIALRANDASTTPKQRSPRLNYAPITFLVRLSQDLITRYLRWPRSYINTVQPSGQHHLFCN